MSDTPALREHFERVKSRGAKAGVSCPVAKIVGLMDAATRMFVQLPAAPLYMHDLRHTPEAHRMPRPGDILPGDRAYCSFGHLALLNARGAFGCSRLHQRRKPASGGMQRWERGPKAPAWLTAGQWLALPQWLDVRIVSYDVAERGFRTLCARMLGLEGVERLLNNPLRSGRSQPRVTRRRMKEYDLMNKPRHAYETGCATVSAGGQLT